MAKHPISEIATGDRIVMRYGSPIKEGTVRVWDEEQVFIAFDDETSDWIDYGRFYISRKGVDITIEGVPIIDYFRMRREQRNE